MTLNHLTDDRLRIYDILTFSSEVSALRSLVTNILIYFTEVGLSDFFEGDHSPS